jgi:hypothetical protein
MPAPEFESYLVLLILFVGTLSCLAAIIIVSLADQAAAAVAIGTVWTATAGALVARLRRPPRNEED